MTALSTAIVGFGPHGRRVAQTVAGLPALRLDAVVDRRPEALASADLPSEVVLLADPDELWLRRPEVVCITTNGPSHAALALAAMEAGARYVMVEKPMACSALECDRMIDAAAHRGVRLAVDQSRRHEPLYRWLREGVAAGEWGELRTIWIQRPGIGLGCLATHSFDLACFLAGVQPRSVSAWVDPFLGPNPRGSEYVDPGGLVVLDLGRCRAVIAQIEDGAGPMSIELDLTAGRVRIDEKSGAIDIIERDRSVVPGPNRPAAYRTAAPPEDLPVRPDMNRMLRGVLAELIGEGPLDCDARFGRAAVEVLVAAHLSSQRNHTPVALPLVGVDREHWLSVT